MRTEPTPDRDKPKLDEGARLDALLQLNLLDSAPSDSFDRIVRMASQIFSLPISAISLTDRDRQWFKSKVGVAHSSIPRDKAPCSYVAEGRTTIVIPDLLADILYADSPLAETGARFYAGAPLITHAGFGLGALCVIGLEPRFAEAREMAALVDLAGIVMAQIELQHAHGRIDPLSGLPNRNQFLEDLADLARDHPGEERRAVLLDLARTDQVNNINRVLGPAHIDDMVQEAARLLRAQLPKGHVGYHIATTQFAFLLKTELATAEIAASLVRRLQELRDQSSVGFLTVAALGVAPFILGEMTARDVLRTAHSAAQDARKSETGVSVYSPESDDAHRRQFRLLHDFGAALTDHGRQLRIVFQPRVALPGGTCVGAEVLMRWRHPELGEISPGEFIPIIEQSSLARLATEWVMDAALAQLAEWQRGATAVPLSVNISATNLEESDFAVRVQMALLRHGVRPDMLEIEVTESAVMENTGNAIAQLEALKTAGIKVSIDDFGTGYSSLAYLQRLPASVVKIDQSFVRGIATDLKAQTLVRSMTTLSHDLGYRVVAEGVETADAADCVTALGCDEAQGYFYARPLEAARFPEWLVAENGAAILRTTNIVIH